MTEARKLGVPSPVSSAVQRGRAQRDWRRNVDEDFAGALVEVARSADW